MKKSGIGMIVGIGLVATAHAADWPQFCGPNRNNVSTETGLADSWPATGPKVLWETEVYDGWSGPAIKAGKVYLIDRDGDDSVLRCMDLITGEPLWKCAFADPGVMTGKKFAGTRGTPTVTTDAVYLMTGYGTLACIDLQTKQVKWKRNLVSDYGLTLHTWGYAQAPCLYGDRVLVAMNTDDANIYSFDKSTGKQLWASPKLGLHGYVSPQVYNLCGVDMVVAIGSSEKPEKRGRRKEGEDAESKPRKEPEPSHVAGLSPDDGTILWDYTGWRCHMTVPHPVEVPGNRLFITGGYDAGSAMIRIVKKGSGFAVEELYRTDEVGSQLQQPILQGKHLFIGSNSNSRKDGFACLALDGKLEWRTKDVEDAPNVERGPFILADGKLILLDGKTGILHLVQADPLKFKLLASAKMMKENDMTWAPLALSDGKLLVRDWNTLKCIDLK